MPVDYERAHRYARSLANTHGNTTAHHRLGFLHSQGLGTQVHQGMVRERGAWREGSPRARVAQSVLHYSMGYFGGDMVSALGLAYRHLMGIHVERSCEEAVARYRFVADKRTAPPPSQTLTHPGQ